MPDAAAEAGRRSGGRPASGLSAVPPAVGGEGGRQGRWEAWRSREENGKRFAWRASAMGKPQAGHAADRVFPFV